MIIKDLINYGIMIKRKLKDLEHSASPDAAEIEFLHCKLNALNVLQNYAVNGDWTRDTSRDKYIALVRSKFDYKLIAQRFHTTRESLDVFAARQDKRLNGRIGEAFRLIEQDRITEGMDCFYALSGFFSLKEFEYKVSNLLPEPEQREDILVSDCSEEAAILRSLLRNSVQKQIDRADRDKLSYLVFLLNTNDRIFSEQKKELISRLRKEDE